MDKASHSYAKGFFELANAEDQAKKISDELMAIKDTVLSNIELRNFFLNKQIGADKKREALQQLFKNQLSSLGENFIVILFEKNNLVFLENVIESYNKEVEEYFGALEVEVVSAYKLDNNEIKSIENTLHKKLNKKTWIRNIVDDSIIGGLKIKIGHKLWDTTIKSSLKKIEEHLMRG